MAASIIVCTNHRPNPAQASCAARGSEALAAALEQAVTHTGLTVRVERIACFGQCEQGPVVRVAPGGRFFFQAGIARVAEIVAVASRETAASNSGLPAKP